MVRISRVARSASTWRKSVSAVAVAVVVAAVAAAGSAVAVAVTVVAAIAIAAAAAAVDVVVVATNPDLATLATSIGERWLHELVHSLRSSDRDVVGAWPGTLREARMRVVAGIGISRALESTVLDDLAKVANTVARRGWAEISEPDPE